MSFLLAKKQNMIQYFDENGRAYPATVLVAGPTTVTQVKSTETDGYNAVQVGFGEQTHTRLSKALRGHLKKSGTSARHVKEFRTPEVPTQTVGDVVRVEDAFKVGDTIVVTGISKGKGFQGVVKRHGFGGGPRSHGQKHSEREPGSIGATWPQRVIKGMKMAGRMGSDRVTVKGLKVLSIDAKQNLLVVSGAVPGRRGTLLEVRSSK
ncbi:MAG: 50S ribosomal protein L3 [Parcubacteria group bacterium]|nr:50S ribosomal protein L3 [Parcubacteria group bacterium]